MIKKKGFLISNYIAYSVCGWVLMSGAVLASNDPILTPLFLFAALGVFYLGDNHLKKAYGVPAFVIRFSILINILLLVSYFIGLNYTS